MGKKGKSSKDDPLHLNNVDREIRVEQLKRRIKSVGGEDVQFGRATNGGPELEEAFLRHVLAFETAEKFRPFETLVREGVNLPPPEELTDFALSSKLWELIRALALRHVFLERTNHLSDRELYSWLHKDALRQEFEGFGILEGNWHVDVLGGCSEEDMILGMRFYASRKERAEWAAEFPDFPMPPKEKPPFQRDSRLPRPLPPH